MSATLIFGVDFKKPSHKAARAFWIGRDKPQPVEIDQVEIVTDTPPYIAPDGDSA